MRIEEETRTYLNITCRGASDRQILNVCRELSRLLNGQEVEIQPAPGFGPFAVSLRAGGAESSVERVERIWTALQPRLRRAHLLDRCVVVAQGPTAETTVQLWPPPGN